MLLTLTIEIDGRDPLRGSVLESVGGSHEFVGWLGLARVLGEIVDAPQSSGRVPRCDPDGSEQTSTA